MQEVNAVSKYSIWAANIFAVLPTVNDSDTALTICDLFNNIVTKKIDKKGIHSTVH